MAVRSSAAWPVRGEVGSAVMETCNGSGVGVAVGSGVGVGGGASHVTVTGSDVAEAPDE